MWAWLGKTWGWSYAGGRERLAQSVGVAGEDLGVELRRRQGRGPGRLRVGASAGGPPPLGGGAAAEHLSEPSRNRSQSLF